MKNDYQMTTVRNYSKLLDEEAKANRQKVKFTLNRHLIKVQQAQADADLLEELLA